MRSPAGTTTVRSFSSPTGVLGGKNSKLSGTRPFAAEVDRIDRELHKLGVEMAALETSIAAGRQELARLRMPPQPGKGDERKDPRALRAELEQRSKANVAAAQKLDAELTTFNAKYRDLDEQRKKLGAERRKPDGEITKLKKQRILIDRELDAAEKPLEGLLEQPMERQEVPEALHPVDPAPQPAPTK